MLHDKIASGKNVRLANKTHMLRNTVADRANFWAQCCLWAHALPETNEHNTESQFKQSAEQFYKDL